MDVQGGWVKLHVGILKAGKKKVREGLSRQKDQHRQTQGNMTLPGKLQVI